MKSTILLTGKTGQVGSQLAQLLPGFGEVVAPARHELDLLDPGQIRQVVRYVGPRLIVNAAAYTAVDAAESDQARAYAINAEAPAVLAEEARKIGAAMVHYSSDYVFDGSKRMPYEETDTPSPINVYGRTKLTGEQAIRDVGVPHLIFRTAWVYAARGRNFLLTILHLATQKEELRIVCDRVGAPTCSWDIAAATARVLKGLHKPGDGSSAVSNVSGTYHLTAAGDTTWYDFGKSILEETACMSTNAAWFSDATHGRQLIAKRIIPITTAEYPTPASRPVYSVLSNSRFVRTFGFELADWRTQMKQMFFPGRGSLQPTQFGDTAVVLAGKRTSKVQTGS
jgi:dTDP-4-dehydrorhamnose reductase